MSFKENLDLYIRARYPVIYIPTFEEERVENEIIELAGESSPVRDVKVWDFVRGFAHDGNAKMNPLAALEAISNDLMDVPFIYILKDFQRFLDDVAVARSLRNLSSQLKQERKTIIIVAPIVKIPRELEEDLVILEYDLPSYAEIWKFISEMTKDTSMEINEKNKEALVKAFQGLTLQKIRMIIAKAIAQKGEISEDDIDLILDEKKQIIKRTEILEFYPATENISDIGGLDNLKAWIKSRSLAFTERAKEYGLPYPKGMLLVGIQGTGKSLSAKAIAREWKMPLLRLDVGRMMGSLVGESEGRTRQMIKTAEAMAPCVLWIDEIDKAFSGVAGYQGDSGTSARVFGTIITWMQEKKTPVFIVATANNIENLPAELLRKGRFDEIFFINLPTQRERREIFEVHLKKKRGYEMRKYNLDLLAEITEGFSGAEIEQLIIDAMFEAFSQEREFTTEDIAASAQKTIPLSKTAKEQIDRLIEWAQSGRARDASTGA